MTEGLLWFDNDPTRKLSDKIDRAATRYKTKFGRRPTICYLNTADFDGATEDVNGIRVRAVTNVLRYHFLIGTEGEAAVAKAA